MNKFELKTIIFCIIILGMMVLVGVLASSCNYQVVDTTYHFNSAILQLPNGEIIEGKVQTWRDYEDGDQIQVRVDGVTYLVHSMNIILISGE